MLRSFCFLGRATMRVSTLIFFVAMMSATSEAQVPEKLNTRRIVKTTNVLGIPLYQNLNINNISSWMRTDGLSNHSPNSNSGVYFPRGTANIIYQDGFLWGGKAFLDANHATPVAYQPIRVGGGSYDIGTRAGAVVSSIANAFPEDPNGSDVRMYRIRRDYPDMTDAEARKDASEYFELPLEYITSSHVTAIRDQYALDWVQWPVHKGAPYVERNGLTGYQPPPPYSPTFSPESLIAQNYDEPGIAGPNSAVPADQVLWTVYNDLDSLTATYFVGSNPLGLEIQTTIWAYASSGALDNVMFRRTRIINKGGIDVGDGVKGAFWIDSMYVAVWSDPDIGNAGDDLVGCDTAKSLGFAFNGSSVDDQFAYFNVPPPTVAYDFFAGPIVPGNPNDVGIFDMQYRQGQRNIGMTAFSYFSAGTLYSDPPSGLYNYLSGSGRWWKMLRGFAPVGDFTTPDVFYPSGPFPPSHFPLSGDPVLGQGFVDGLGTDYSFDPGDRRIILASGPFRLAPGDTQETVVAMVAGIGSDRLSSVGVMKFYDGAAQMMFDGLFTVTPPTVTAQVTYPNSSQATVAFSAVGSKPAPVTMTITVKRFDGSEVGTLELFDDGAHNDGAPADGVFGNSMTINRESQALVVDAHVTDIDAVVHSFASVSEFITTAGRVELVALEVFSDNQNNDLIVNPGEQFRFGLSLSNFTAFPLQHLRLRVVPELDEKSLIVGIAQGTSYTMTYDPGNPNTYFTASAPFFTKDSSFSVIVKLTDTVGNVWTDEFIVPVKAPSVPFYGVPTQHIAGESMWSFSTLVVDRSALTDALYEITIADSTGQPDIKLLNLKNLASGLYLMYHHALPDAFGYAMPVTEGFKVLRGSDWEAVGFNQYQTGWSGPGSQWLTGGRFATTGSGFFNGVLHGSDLSQFLGQVNTAFDPGGAVKIEIRFDLAAPQRAYRLRRTGSNSEYQLQTDIIPIYAPGGEPYANVPFQVWDVSNPDVPRQLTVSWRDNNRNGLWDPTTYGDNYEIVFIHYRTYDPSCQQYTYPANPTMSGTVINNELTVGAGADIMYGLALQVLPGHSLNESAGVITVAPGDGLTTADVFAFKTQVPPDVPQLVYPMDGMALTNHSQSPYLVWQSSPGADVYRLQIATDSYFSTVVFDDSTFTGASTLDSAHHYRDLNLQYFTLHYWRVSARNPYGASEWSPVWSFTTDRQGVPSSWRVSSMTFDNIPPPPTAMFVLNSNISPSINGRMIQEDDAVGAFFRRSDSMICGGYFYWVNNATSIALTLFGDDTTTQFKEGFATDDTVFFRAWDPYALKEFHAFGGVGGVMPTFSPNTFITLTEFFTTTPVTAVKSEDIRIPLDFDLRRNYPNPFNPSTTLEYQLPIKSSVSLEVFNLLGQRVAELIHEVQEPGYYSKIFDARELPSGIYIARLTAGNFIKHEKMLLLK